MSAALHLSCQPALAQLPAGQLTGQQTAAIQAANRNQVTYDRLPSWAELSSQQQRLLKTYAGCPSGLWADCWQQLSEDLRAVFFMITYALERTSLQSAPLIQHVVSIEGVLVPARVDHHHTLTNVKTTVDGWRIHLLIQGISVTDLVNAKWKRDSIVVGTHSAFAYTQSFRDHRERSMYRGPFLQLVLNATSTSSDSDLDKGAWEHSSSPKDIYERFRDRFPEIQSLLVIG